MFESFIDSLPPKVRCTDDFSQGTKFRKKENALGFKYIEISQLLKKQIIIDIDRPGAAFEWEKLNLPSPSWITINPDNAHCHYCYELNTPVVYTEQGRRKPQEYYESITSALTNKLQGDPCYIGHITKNPLHPAWKTINHRISYDLGDFNEYISMNNTIKPSKSLVYDVHGRNSTLFENVRRWAYREVKAHSDRETFFRAVENEAIAVNAQFINWQEGILHYKEVLSTAHSIAKWTWKHRHSINEVNRGVMNLPQEMLLKDKQTQSALYVADIKTSKTTIKLLEIARAIKASKKSVSQKTVADIAEMNLRTVKRHWDFIAKELKLYR